MSQYQSISTHDWPTNITTLKWIIISTEKKGKSEGFDSCNWPDSLTQIGFKSSFFCPCDIEIWWMTSKNNRTPLQYYIKLCASFQSHQWIQTGVTFRKCSIRVKIEDFSSCMTLKLEELPSKSIGHLFYITSSFMYHFKAMGEFKLKLQSTNSQLGSKLMIFCPVWPSNLTDDLEKQQITFSMLIQALCLIS